MKKFSLVILVGVLVTAGLFFLSLNSVSAFDVQNHHCDTMGYPAASESDCPVGSGECCPSANFCSAGQTIVGCGYGCDGDSCHADVQNGWWIELCTDGTACTVPAGGTTVRNGACGTAAGTGATTRPTGHYCSTGTHTAIVGSAPGPWTWDCNGRGSGHTNASCTTAAPVVAAPVYAPYVPPSTTPTCGNPTLTWQASPMAGMFEIYKNDVVIATTSNLVGSYVVNGVSPLHDVFKVKYLEKARPQAISHNVQETWSFSHFFGGSQSYTISWGSTNSHSSWYNPFSWFGDYSGNITYNVYSGYPLTDANLIYTTTDNSFTYSGGDPYSLVVMAMPSTEYIDNPFGFVSVSFTCPTVPPIATSTPPSGTTTLPFVPPGGGSSTTPPGGGGSTTTPPGGGSSLGFALNCSLSMTPFASSTVSINTNTVWTASSTPECSACRKIWTLTDSNNPTGINIPVTDNTSNTLNKIFTTVGLKTIEVAFSSTTNPRVSCAASTAATTTVVQSGTIIEQ